MKSIEIALLSFLLLGISIFSLGSFLYLRNLIVEYGASTELQLVLVGFFLIIIALVIMKIFSKVELDGRI